ncbi:OmpA family protein [Rhizobium sp. PP-CC-3G-465]|uniref:OmpA family protein n=1 Tax=Rhizobium sp. PP-CC-3G-465 TaxID=2135648 RepID=UPI0010483E77|nr:outer membrane protein OmpA-like peptidoglycan-associated protein [Rhizobium sp. PP-CC-3G-465]
MSKTAAGAEGRGYNRGLILGFTMAESLLLVVFCLLLVSAALITRERERAAAAERRADAIAREVAIKDNQLDGLNKRLAEMNIYLAAADGRKSEDEWRELVLAKKTMDALAVQLPDSTSDTIVEEIKEALEETRELRLVDARRRELEDELAEARSQIERMQVELDEKSRQLAALETSGKPHEWPPIITLSEANNNYFRSGSAELTTAFADKLGGSISNQIANNLKTYGADIVEVIGHTDEQPVSRGTSTMDRASIDVLRSRKAVTALEPADNAGLGLARAISVANVLKANGALAGVTVLPLSAAQLILPGDTLTVGEAGNVETRRRIEIRIRRRDAAAQ